MEARLSTWAHVKVGRHIRSKEGVAYKVVANGKGHWGLVDRDGNEKIIPEPPLDAPVSLFFLTQDELERQIMKEFPGTTLEAIKRPEDSIFLCPPFDDRRATEMVSHIKLMHRHWAGNAGMKTPKQLREAHTEMHLHPSHQWMPHVHSDRLTTRVDPFEAEIIPTTAQEVRP